MNATAVVDVIDVHMTPTTTEPTTQPSTRSSADSSVGSSAEAMASFRRDVERRRRQRASGRGQLQARPLGPVPAHVRGAASRRRSAQSALAPTRTRRGRSRAAGTMSAMPTTPGATGAPGAPGEPGGQHQEVSRPGSRGAAWSPAEDEQLVRELLDGLLVEDIATAHQRTTGAIYSRASRMVPVHPQVPTGRRERVEWLREQLHEQLHADASPLPEELQGWSWQESLQARRARRAERTSTSEPSSSSGAGDVEAPAPAAPAPAVSTQTLATSTSNRDAADSGAASSRAVGKPVRHGKPWTPIEDALLLRGLEQEQSLTRLAGIHQRRARSVLLHAERLLGIPADTTQAQADRMAVVQQRLRNAPLPALPELQMDTGAPVNPEELGEPPARSGAKWKTDEDAQLLRELAGPSPIVDIAAAHERSAGAIHARVHVLTPDLQRSAVTSAVLRRSAPTAQDLIAHTAAVRALLRGTPGVTNAAAATAFGPAASHEAPMADAGQNRHDEVAHELVRDVLGAQALEIDQAAQVDDTRR
ncbi:hypothetical protein [Kineococcus indalonis]|uniref:hypothetical protein n=1 Tax=Kineococcus indalonis TaxID=2696566 RepID=UPI001411F6D4|nr:hypothetical protein [Kineococcus indalonis]NAZ84631.1 hypothetical protein [Kineococcus indalonis]